MAKIRIAIELLEHMVFGQAMGPVRVLSRRFNHVTNDLECEIEGPDVPDVEEVNGVLHAQQNRAGQRLVTMTFDPIAKPAPAARNFDFHCTDLTDEAVAQLLERHGPTVRRWMRQWKSSGAIA